LKKKKNWSESWINRDIRLDKNKNRYLHSPYYPKNKAWENDIMLEPIRTLQKKPILKIRYRTNDNRSSIYLLTEIDDIEKKYDKMVLVIDVKKSKETSSNKTFAFRTKEYNKKIPFLYCGNYITPNGQWQTIRINGKSLLEEQRRFSFQRWVNLRSFSELDFDDIILQSNDVNE
jgi:hypothetical protein